MLTLDQMRDKWPHIKFNCSENILAISFMGKFVDLSYSDVLDLPMNEFEDRILNPAISAIETKIKQENNQNA